MSLYRYLLCLCLISASSGHGFADELVHVGVVLDEETHLGKTSLYSILAAVEDFYDANLNYSTRLVIHARDSGGEVSGAAWAAHDLLKDVGVQTILGSQTSPQAELLAGFGQKAEVPIISFSATSPSISPSEKPYFIRAAFDDPSQVNAISSLLGHFGFKEVVPLWDGTSNGASWVAHLVEALRVEGIQVPYTSSIAYRSTDDQTRDELRRLIEKRARVFVVHLSLPLASRLFLEGKDIGLMGNGYVWVVSDAVANFLHELDASAVRAMRGVIGVRPSLPNESELRHLTAHVGLKLREENPNVELKQLCIFALWAYDAVWALARAAETAREISGHESRGFRRKLAAEVSNAKFRGKSGDFHVSGGQLKASGYEMVNVVGEKARLVGVWSQNTSRLSFSSQKIVWPGDSRAPSRGWEMAARGKKLRVLVPRKSDFLELVNVKFNRKVPSEPLFSGFCVKVFDMVMTTALRYKVEYEFWMINERETSSSYDELINLLLSKKYDAIVGDITIMANRSEYVDFTLPYTGSGVWMLVRTEQNDSASGWIFLKPLEMDLWGVFLAFFIFTGSVIWAIEHRINPEFQGSPNEQLGTTFYFVFSTLVYAHRQELRSNLSRLAVIVWIFVVLILISSYTASLASMLTVQRLQPATVEELLRNDDYVGYQRGSFVEKLLRGMNFHPSKMKGYKSPEEYEAALLKGSRNGGVTAIFDEIPYLMIFLASRCREYNVFGPVMNTKGFGFVFPRGSPLAADTSRAILNATDHGLLGPVEKEFFGDDFSCRLKNSAFETPRLSFKRFSGLFILSGVVSALALVASFTKYIWQNWAELKDVSSGRSFWKKVSAWACHYVRVDPTVDGEESRTPHPAPRGGRSSTEEAMPTNEGVTEKTVEDGVTNNPLREAEVQLRQEPPVELQELRRRMP